MNPVSPDTKTTLLLNYCWQPFNWCTARATLKHLMSDKSRGIDAAENLVSWTGNDVGKDGNILTTYSWYGNRVQLHDHQPCLRSAPDPVTGTEREWAIPTILVCHRNFGITAKKGTKIATRRVYKKYKGICQYCLQKIPLELATKDHVVPKDSGGPDEEYNIVLACKPCNNKKDNIFPYYDINGKEVKAKYTSPQERLIETAPKIIHDEWKVFLHL